MLGCLALVVTGSDCVAKGVTKGAKGSSSLKKTQNHFEVVATVMTNAAGKKLANSKKNDANTRAFVALPSRRALGRFVTVFSPETGRKAKNVPVADVGPWSTKDNYWEKGTRPMAEKGLSNMYKIVKNKAGIDLSLKLCKDLGLPFPYKGVVRWNFEEEPIVATN